MLIKNAGAPSVSDNMSSRDISRKTSVPYNNKHKQSNNKTIMTPVQANTLNN